MNTITLSRVLEHVFKYIGVKEEETRKRAIKLFYACLENFADACAPGEDEEEVGPFLVCFFALKGADSTFFFFGSPRRLKPMSPSC